MFPPAQFKSTKWPITRVFTANETTLKMFARKDALKLKTQTFRRTKGLFLIMAYENELIVCWLKRIFLAQCFCQWPVCPSSALLQLANNLSNEEDGFWGTSNTASLPVVLFNSQQQKIANVHQHDEAFLEPLNISVDKKTQEKGTEIRLDWYFAIWGRCLQLEAGRPG